MPKLYCSQVVGQSCEICVRWCRGDIALLGCTLELEAGPERHDPALRNADLDTCFRIAAGP